MMLQVVENGTGVSAQIPYLDVAGKTGTAQLGSDPPRSHAWIIGFAGPEGKEPSIAVAVLIEGQPGASEQTGGRVAAPIAQAVLAAYLQG
jgi:peptidoglycan glycosyltransferase